MLYWNLLIYVLFLWTSLWVFKTDILWLITKQNNHEHNRVWLQSRSNKRFTSVEIIPTLYFSSNKSIPLSFYMNFFHSLMIVIGYFDYYSFDPSLLPCHFYFSLGFSLQSNSLIFSKELTHKNTSIFVYHSLVQNVSLQYWYWWSVSSLNCKLNLIKDRYKHIHTHNTYIFIIYKTLDIWKEKNHNN